MLSPLHWQWGVFATRSPGSPSFPFKNILKFIFGCAGSSLLHVGLLCLQPAGATLVTVHGLLIAVASLVGECRL